MIDNTYTFQEIIGFGGSSKVFSAVDCNNNTVAIKAIRSDKFDNQEVARMMVLREYLVMDHVGEHPNIIKHSSCNPEGLLEHEGMTQQVSYNIMEYCKNGSLSTIIKRTGGIEESISKFIFTQLCSAVKFLHDKQFAHLDIKLENLLLDECFNVKLADFGWGVSLQKTWGYTDHKVGTPLYMAPEIKNLEKNQKYDGRKADIYSLGVTLSLLLLGQVSDFSEISDGSTVGSSQISECSDNMDVDIEDPKHYLSTSSKELLSFMLHQDPNKRPSVDDILSHDWMAVDQPTDNLLESVYLEMSARVSEVENTSNF